MDNTKDWKYPKENIKSMLDKVKEQYKVKRDKKKHNMMDNECKIIIRASILLIIAFIYAFNLGKCFKIKNESKVLTNFTRNLSPNESNIYVERKFFFTLSIPFCSCLYDDGYFLTQHTYYYKTCLLAILLYFNLECLLIYKHTFIYLLKPFYIRLIMISIINITSITHFQYIFSIYLYVISFLFEMLNYFFLHEHSFNWPSFLSHSGSNLNNNNTGLILIFQKYIDFQIRMTESTMFRDEMYLIINSISLIVMYVLHKRLQLCGRFGVVVIKHTSILKKFTKYIAFFRLFIWPLSDTINKSSLWIYYQSYNSTVHRTKLSDLDNDIKKLFVNELNTFVYEESLFNELFCWFIFLYILFFLVLLVLYFLDKTDNLELAEIEQHLIKYYWDFPWWLKPFKARSFSHFLKSTPFYELYIRILGKSKVEIALEKIKRKWELDELSLFCTRRETNNE